MNTNANMLSEMELQIKNTDDKAVIFDAFAPVFHDVKAKRDEIITRLVVLTYRAMWRKKAWKGGGHKSANAMFRALLGIAEGKVSKIDRERVKAEVNFSHYVRNNSPAALALSGKKRGGKGSAVTLDSFAAYVEKAVNAVTLADQNAVNAAAAILAAVTAWHDKAAATLKIAA